MKRHAMPKNWPIYRKGTTFIVEPNSDLNKGIPVLILLRDILKLAQNKKEVKKAIYAKNILLNNKHVKDEKQGVVLFDVLTIVPIKKSYRTILSKTGKFDLEEIKESDLNKKVSKVVNKKILKGKKVQLNLSDGRNYLSNIKCETNDSVLIDFKKNAIEKCLALKEKANIVVFAGKHSGKKGSINKLKLERKMVEMKVGEEKINVLIKQLMVVE